AARWEEDTWEMFAGSGGEIARGDVRVVPVGTLLGNDPSLKRAVELPIGSAIWRDTGDWKDWDGGRR
ncbi:MAG TPA: hypothetical protein VMZ53_33640, partial [Kofleriaceae bacterium]|nr:hypothetical protein [Kofleriaceae bacterium]